MKKSSQNAQITFKQQTFDFPVCPATLGQEVIDIKNLGQHGVFTLDEGFYSTAACESKITFIDGDQGILLYRGYPIDQLAAQCDFLDICFLLIHGELPNTAEKKQFFTQIHQHEVIENFSGYVGFPNTAHPLSLLIAGTSILAAQFPELIRPSAENRMKAAIEIIAKMPMLTAMAYRHSLNKTCIAPRSDLSYAENFLHMMFAESEESPLPKPLLSQALDRILTLHADHEQNASTSTVRMAGSTGTHPYAAIGAGIAALWGPAHGGANEACIQMLKNIGDEKHIPEYIKRAKDPNDSFRLMGFGHRVYKNYDPRAKVMRDTCHDILDVVGRHDDPLFKLALKLEEVALSDPYFIEKKLYPNVDFYSGLTLSALGFPTNMFTAIFALSRTAGWISHWLEMVSDPQHRLARPRQLYTGPTKRNIQKSS